MSAQPARQPAPARTIDEVIEQLGEIIDRSRRDKSRIGYFAALYRNVTVEVKRGIAQGRFQDGPRMERLDVNFANRYLRALDCRRRGETASKSWVFAFNVAPQWPPIVLQHLLLGMNAHINLDLGAAAAMTCPGDELPGLKHDFDEINNILAAMVGGVRFQLSRISPWMKVLDLVGARTQNVIINFSIDRARDFAWSVAERLASLSPEEAQREIEKLDGEVVVLSKIVRNPGAIISLANLIVRASEVRSVPRIIDILA